MSDPQILPPIGYVPAVIEPIVPSSSVRPALPPVVHTPIPVGWPGSTVLDPDTVQRALDSGDPLTLAAALQQLRAPPAFSIAIPPDEAPPAWPEEMRDDDVLVAEAELPPDSDPHGARIGDREPVVSAIAGE